MSNTNARVSALLPAVLIASSLTVALPGASMAYEGHMPRVGGALPAVMQTLPSGFNMPETLAAYEEEKSADIQVSRKSWGDDGSINRCGTTSGCASGWDDSDCF